MKMNFNNPQVNIGSVNQRLKQMLNSKNTINKSPATKHVNPFEDPSMCLTGKEHLKVIVPISNDMKDQIINQVHEDFRLRNGMTPMNDNFSEIKKAYTLSSPSDKRISVAWTLDQTQINEAQRIVDFIKSKDPTWTNGKPIKPEILEEALRPKLNLIA